MHEELASLLPSIVPKRRQFVVTALATGFAMAVQPISADTTITTDTKGLEAGEVKIPVKYDGKEGEMPAYRAMPDGKGPFPVVLVALRGSHVTRKTSEITVIETGKNDWVVDKLP